MNRILNVFCLLLCWSLAGCSRSDNAEVAKARAEVKAAKDEAAKSKSELEALRTRSVGEKVNPTPVSTGKMSLAAAGVATFPDGRKRPFTNIWSVESQDAVATVVGQIGGGDFERPYIKFQELLPQSPPMAYLKYKERNVGLGELLRISFGIKQLRAVELNDGTKDGRKFEQPFCEVELEATNGTKEKFPCVLDDYPKLAIAVQFADGIGKEKLLGDLLYGMTFRAGE